jgi:hypothetical protein
MERKMMLMASLLATGWAAGGCKKEEPELTPPPITRSEPAPTAPAVSRPVTPPPATAPATTRASTSQVSDTGATTRPATAEAKAAPEDEGDASKPPPLPASAK